MNDSRLRNSNDNVSKKIENDSAAFGNESDPMSFWLLLLFVAVFFGIAAKESHGTLFSSKQQAATTPMSFQDLRRTAEREFDLTSRSRPEKTEVPATGK